MVWSQLTANGLISAGIYLLIGLGFSLTYRVSRFFNFSYGIIFTFGAYMTYAFKGLLGLPLLPAAIIGVICACLLGVVYDLAFFRFLRRNNASPLILLLVSLGLYIVTQNLISIIFGDDIKSIRSLVSYEGYSIFGARITPVQLTTITLGIVLTLMLVLLLKHSRMGNSMRAVANDYELANITGLDSNIITLYTFIIGSGLAGIAGILFALDVDMTPTMGLNALMMCVVAVIIGGVGSIPGVALGALLLGMARHYGVWYIGTQWQDAIAFIILLVFLIFRPEGFLGKKVKKASV